MDDAINLGTPHVFEGELAVMESALGQSKRYLEFGLGGSSLMAVRSGVETIVSVDSDPRWVDAVKRHAEIAPRIADGSMSVLHGNIGPVREWGNPLDRSEIHLWPNYLAVAWAEWTRRGTSPDLVFVDGRFRIACCLSVVIATRANGENDSPRVMLHDFNDERPQYREVLDFFEVIEAVNSLYLLRIRKDVSTIDAIARLLRRQFDYG